MDELPVDVFGGMTAVLDGCSMQTWTENGCGICLFGFSLLVYIFVLFFVLLFVCLLFLLWLLIFVRMHCCTERRAVSNWTCANSVSVVLPVVE